MRIIDVSLLCISASLGFFLAWFIARNRHAPGARALSVYILGASIWALSYAFEVIASSLTYKLLWEKFEYLGIVIIPIAWFTFVAQYTGNSGWMKQILRLKVPLGIIPVVTLILVWSNSLHSLVWRSVSLETIGPLVVLEFARGPWFWVLLIFSYLLIILGSFKLATSLVNIVKLHRWQVILALVAILLPWASYLLYLTGWAPEHFLDWNAFLFLVSGILLLVSLFRYHLVNIMPIAQEAVFAGIADSILVLDMQGCVLEMNPSAKNMLNCKRDELLGKNINEMMPELSSYIRDTGSAKEYKVEICRNEGKEEQFYEAHITSLTDPYMSQIGKVIVLHEITKQKQYQAELENAREKLETIVTERTAELHRAIELLKKELEQRTLAEKRFEDVIELAPDAMFLLEKSGKILLMNAMAERLFDFPREELIGKDITSNLIPERFRKGQRQYFGKFLGNPAINQSSFGVDLFAMRKNGTEFPMEVTLSRLETSDGFWVAINVRDISIQKQAEAALRESEQTYRTLFENAGEAIIMTDLHSNILQANQKAMELLGFTQAELQALSILDLTTPEELEDVRRNMKILVSGGELMPYIRHYLKKSGEIVSTENITVLVHDAIGKPKFFQNISRDITERIKAEEAQTRLMEEIRQSNEQMRDLALRLQEVQELERQELATVLHDRVGQNLTGLNLNLKILQNQLEKKGEEEIQKRLEDSLTIVEETTHQIRNVMADLNPPILDEYGLLPAIKWYCGEFSNRTGIATYVGGDKLSPRLAPSIEKIVFRLVQESLNNVAKHAHASQVVVSLISSKEALSVTVKDNGIGFNPHEIQKTSLEPHWGLSSMQRRAASIGANFAITSNPGMGTQVSVNLRRNHHGD